MRAAERWRSAAGEAGRLERQVGCAPSKACLQAQRSCSATLRPGLSLSMAFQPPLGSMRKCPRLLVLTAAEDDPDRGLHRARPRRRVLLGAVDGRSPARLDPGRARLLLLRRALRHGPYGRCQRVGDRRGLRPLPRCQARSSGFPSRSSARSTLMSTANPFLSGSRSFSG